MKKVLAALLAAALFLALAGCAPQPSPAAATTDFLGNALPAVKAPQRIVSLTPSNTEILFALGLGSKVVGVDALSDYPDAVRDIPKAGDFNGPNIETVVSMKPDLVLAGNKLQKDAVDKLKALGLNVVASEATTYEDVYKSIDLVASLTGAQKQAKALEADMRANEKAVLSAVAKASKGKKVYYAISFGDSGNWTGGPGSFPFELINLCGGKNITESFPVAWVEMSQEQLVSADPDIILLDSGMGEANSRDAFMKADAYKNLSAVKAGQVFVVTSNYCTRPGPRIVYGLREFAEAITGQKIKFPGE